jgi:Pyruvate/2-oxoacid:ferredoxin oxidoreductase gamma subunit
LGSTGAAVTAFVRADLKPIRLRCQVERPDAPIILDATLLDDPGTPTGPKPEGWVIINTDLQPNALSRSSSAWWRWMVADTIASGWMGATWIDR